MTVELINGISIDMKIVKELESKLQVSFPNEYVEFITNNNGAYVFPNAFRVGDIIERIINFYDVEKTSQSLDERLPEV
ncbi:SMI1/KNR4 family protein [Bacillus salitolerans]|uniref:SMI1/KNR4 family protein n=1 Tax=Bacillus salitolerans TaxID=1437434 RepID=A0ABW4LWK4_9BACI